MSYIQKPIKGEGLYFEYDSEDMIFKVYGSDSGAVVFSCLDEDKCQKFCEERDWEYDIVKSIEEKK